MSNIPHLSEALYVELCRKIGTREEVLLRREIATIKDVIHNKSGTFGDMKMLSGSSGEGFRLSGSDLDIMSWPQNWKVICDLSQAHYYRQPRTTLFLMEYTESRPGFVLLQLLTPPSHDRELKSVCVRVNDVFFISSTEYRKYVFHLFGEEYKEHGPCSNVVRGGIEYDYAHCFSCDFWPPIAESWIRRCHSWPCVSVLYEIIVSGCHAMAIGNKGSPKEYIEWRLSFSQAEQKLVYAMNHSQFLVYGLLKLFLKEAINQDDHENLLCSYFMKTAVFWEIQENNVLCWCPQNILLCFWSCYKRIVQWVYNGYCPNFFVPQNNMFLGKIYGSAQNTLFLHLHKLYQKGLPCLLCCQFIRSYFYDTFFNPTNITDFTGINILINVNFARGTTYEIFEVIQYRTDDMSQTLRFLKTIQYLSKTYLTKHQGLFLHLNAISGLSCTAFSIQQLLTGGNKDIYATENVSCEMLKIVARSGFVSDMLYLAMFYYSRCRYEEALSILQLTEIQFTQQNLTYNGRGNVEKYIFNIGGQLLVDFWKKIVYWVVLLKTEIIYINQLTLEQKVSFRNGKTRLAVPSFVLLRMLFVLCYNHINTDRRQEAMQQLYTLVHQDTGNYIFKNFRDITYQILGICQEICGDFSSAIDSFNLSLRCKPLNGIEEASLIRIQHAHSKLSLSY